MSSPALCTCGPAVSSIAFTRKIKDEGTSLPEDLIRLFAAFDGFDLNAAGVPDIPVFGMLESSSLEVNDAVAGYPRRVAAFSGGDEVQLSVAMTPNKEWVCVYEHDYQPVAMAPLSLEALLEFGLRRAEEPNLDRLNQVDSELSWERFFNTQE
ncbi:MAG: hypothetical protein ACKVPX_02500 [Myxococcaceae bacterium]